MLSESKGVNRRISKFDRPMLAQPVTVRVIFQKKGNLQFFSHLDLQRTWQRVLVRASIPMWYTQGFNPHSKIVFGVPLPVGTESVCEMVDLRLDREISCREIRDQLNAEVTDEMQVVEVYPAETKYTDVAWASYEITLQTAGLPASPEDAADLIRSAFDPSKGALMMTKRSKSGEKDVDILPMIRSLEVSCEAGQPICIKAMLAAGCQENLNPEYLIEALRKRLGLLPESGDPKTTWYRILRTGFYKQDGEVFR